MYPATIEPSAETPSATLAVTPGKLPKLVKPLSSDQTNDCSSVYDDFPFYRGLVGDMIRWSVIDDGATLGQREGRRNLYTIKIGTRGLVFCAYGIGRAAPPASKTAREMLDESRRVATVSTTSPRNSCPRPDRNTPP